MRKYALLAALLLLAAAPTQAASINYGGSATVVGLVDENGNPITAANPLDVSSSGGGGGGAVTVADGADATQGTTTDSACATDNGTCTVEALIKRTNQRVTSLITALGSPFQAGGSIGNSTIAVTQATAASLNATVVGTGTFVTQSTLAAETTKVIGTVNVAAAQTIAVTNAGTFATQSTPTPGTSGGLAISSTIIPNNTTAIVVKASAGQLYKVRCTNNSAVIAYIKIYNATSATAGSGTPVDRIMCPSSTSGAGIIDTTDIGAAYSTGITYVVTTGIADADTAAPAASAYIVTFFYK